MRTRITWLIGGAVVALLVLAGVDALRSAVSRPSAPTASVPTTKPASAPVATETEWGNSGPIRQYVFGAHAICAQANGDLLRAARGFPGPGLEEIGEWYEAAARAAQNSLSKLRALPAPEADQAVIDDFFSGVEKEIDALRNSAAAASAGDRQRVRVLVGKQVDAIHAKDARADDLSARWRVDDPEILRGCPVSLPG
jgi:hypothetical protein